MKTPLLALSILILTLTFVSASDINLVGEEPYVFDLGESYEYYEITENTTEINLNVSQNGTIVTIIADKYMKDGNFTINFYNWKDEVIPQSSGGSLGGGGSSGIIYNLNENQIKNGYEKRLNRGDMLKFDGHILMFQGFKNGKAKFKFQSEPIYFELGEQEQTRINFTDHFYQIGAWLFDGRSVMVAFFKVNNDYLSPISTSKEEPSEEPTGDICPMGETCDEPEQNILERNGDVLSKVIIIIGIIIILCIIFFLKEKYTVQKGGQNKDEQEAS